MYHKHLNQQVRRIARPEVSSRRVIGEAAPERFFVRENGVTFELSFDEESGAARDYRFVEVNPAFAKQTGLSDAEGRWMRTCAIVTPPAIRTVSAGTLLSAGDFILQQSPS